MMVVRILRYHFLKTFPRPRTIFTALLALTLVQMFTAPFRTLAASMDIRADFLPLFGLIGDNTVASGLLFCCWIFWVSDAPYWDRSQELVLLRCGHTRFCAGTIAYLLCLSMLYWLFIFLLSVVLMLPSVSFSADFGDFHRALNRGAGNEMIGMGFYFSKKLEQLLPVVQVFFLSWSLHALVSFMLALLIHWVNLWRGKAPGHIFALLLVLFDFGFLGLGMPDILYFFSPVSLCNLAMLDMTGTTFRPSVSYAYGFLIGSAAFLAFASLLHVSRLNWGRRDRGCRPSTCASKG